MVRGASPTLSRDTVLGKIRYITFLRVHSNVFESPAAGRVAQVFLNALLEDDPSDRTANSAGELWRQPGEFRRVLPVRTVMYGEYFIDTSSSGPIASVSLSAGR
jgi:hypothetical protein